MLYFQWVLFERCWWSTERYVPLKRAPCFFLVTHVVKNLLELTNGETNEIAESDPSTSTDNNDFYSILTTMRLFDKHAYLI